MSPELQSLDHSPRAAPARDQMLGCANKLQWRSNQTPKRQAFWGHTFMTSATFFISTRRRLQMCAVGLVAALVGCASGGGSAPDAALSQSESGIGQAISTLGGFLSPYRPDILQGNVITKEQVAALKVGMSKEQVAGALGTPLLQSVFHNNRWDYVFTWARQGYPDQQRNLTTWFEDGKLAKFVGDDMPSELEFVQSISRPVNTEESLPLQATSEQLKLFQTQQAELKAKSTAPKANNATIPASATYPALNEQVAQ